MRPRIELKTLQAFVTVAATGNVSRAAGDLCLSQPAVSLQLKKLATETGLTLFRRGPHGLDLTPDGAALRLKAEQVLAAAAEFDRTASRLTQTLRGTLSVGTVVDPGFIRLGGFLGALMAAAPELKTRLAQGMSGEVLARLLRGDLDIGYFLGDADDMAMLAGAEAATVDWRALTRIRYRVLAPRHWEARVAGLDWAGAAALPWIGTPPASVHHRLLRRVFEPLGVTQNRVTEADQEVSMLALVRSGVGLCLVREPVALDEAQQQGLVVAGDLAVETPLALIARRARLDEPAIALAQQVMAGLWPG